MHRVAASRTSHPGLADLIIDLISLDYNETLMAAAGHQVEAARTRRDGAPHRQLHPGDRGCDPDEGRRDLLQDRRHDFARPRSGSARRMPARSSRSVRALRGAVFLRPSRIRPAPRALRRLLEGKTVVTIPGCPSNPYNFLGVALQYATFGTLPELDALARPKFAYGRIDPRALPAARPLRRGPIRPPVR